MASTYIPRTNDETAAAFGVAGIPQQRRAATDAIVGESARLKSLLRQVSLVAPTDSTVLILGETGTGKELIARAIHELSNRSSRPFIRVNCAAIPPSLIASELFGHEKGSFTGALQRRQGRFEAANGGTIFLDEIGELPMETQIALLRVIQEREFERVGSSHAISVDVRIIAATNRDLEAAVTTGEFREDMFYRLNVFPIYVPALRERLEDIPLLVEHLVERYAQKVGKEFRTIKMNTIETLQAYDWPGNIRELQNVLRNVVLFNQGSMVTEAMLNRLDPASTPRPAAAQPIAALAPTPRGDQSGSSTIKPLWLIEKEAIEGAIALCNGNIPRAAALLEVNPSTIYRRKAEWEKERLLSTG